MPACVSAGALDEARKNTSEKRGTNLKKEARSGSRIKVDGTRPRSGTGREEEEERRKDVQFVGRERENKNYRFCSNVSWFSVRTRVYTCVKMAAALYTAIEIQDLVVRSQDLAVVFPFTVVYVSMRV